MPFTPNQPSGRMFTKVFGPLTEQEYSYLEGNLAYHNYPIPEECTAVPYHLTFEEKRRGEEIVKEEKLVKWPWMVELERKQKETEAAIDAKTVRDRSMERMLDGELSDREMEGIFEAQVVMAENGGL